METESLENIKLSWTIDKETIISQLKVDKKLELTSNEPNKRLNTFGLNTIDSPNETSFVKILVNQFVSPFVLLLGVAAGLSFLEQR